MAASRRGRQGQRAAGSGRATGRQSRTRDSRRAAFSDLNIHHLVDRGASTARAGPPPRDAVSIGDRRRDGISLCLLRRSAQSWSVPRVVRRGPFLPILPPRRPARPRLCMDSTATTTLAATSTLATTPTPDIPLSDTVPAHHASPVVAFIIGLAIVTLASILNAAGLNLTKLDHVSTQMLEAFSIWLTCPQVRTSAIPKAARRRDWLRPLWLLGMILYMCVILSITLWSRSSGGRKNLRGYPFGRVLTSDHRLSQLIGSTLALEYMRAGMHTTRSFWSACKHPSRIRCSSRIYIINLQLSLR